MFWRRFGASEGFRLFIKHKTNNFTKIDLLNFPGPIFLRKNSTDFLAFYQVFLQNEYNIHIPFYPEFIIDAGANIGLFSVFMKNRFPDAKIICVEPDEENYRSLKKNMASYADIHCEHAGLWSADSRLTVCDEYEEGKWGLVVKENDTSGETFGTSMETLIEKYSFQRIDILKLDIETSEKEVFSKNYSKWLSKTKVIIIELHDRKKSGCSKAFFEAINQTLHHYDFFTSGENVVIINNDLP